MIHINWTLSQSRWIFRKNFLVGHVVFLVLEEGLLMNAYLFEFVFIKAFVGIHGDHVIFLKNKAEAKSTK